MKGSEQSHLVSSSTVPDPQDPKRNIQLVGTKTDPKDSRGNVQPADKGLPSTVSNEGVAKTTLSPEGPRGDKDSEGLKPTADMEPHTNPVANPLGTDAKYHADQTQSARLSDDEEVFAVGEDMDEDTQVDEEVQSSPLNTDKPELSLVQDTDESTFDSSPELKKYDNILPLTERQLVKYLRKATMDSLDKTATDRTNLLKALTEVTETLKVMRDAIKDDPTLNKKVIEATEAYTKNLTALTELLTLAKLSTFMAWKLSPRMTVVESSQAEIRYKLSSLRQDTSDIKSIMTEIYQASKIQDTDKDKVDKEQVSKELKHVVPISTVKPTKTPTPEVIGTCRGRKRKNTRRFEALTMK
ncbi:hypothetical protein Tco_0128701 [Tanacetum coccineum]